MEYVVVVIGGVPLLVARRTSLGFVAEIVGEQTRVVSSALEFLATTGEFCRLVFVSRAGEARVMQSISLADLDVVTRAQLEMLADCSFADEQRQYEATVERLQSGDAAAASDFYTRSLERVPSMAFHWTSRLALYMGEPVMIARLPAYRERVVGKDGDVLERVLAKVDREMYADGESLNLDRRQALIRYSKLLTMQGLLVRAFFARSLYGKDIRHVLLSVFPERELLATYASLRANVDDVRTLSTYAVNFMSGMEQLFGTYFDLAPDPSFYLDLLRTGEPGKRPRNDVYLATHAVIGATGFYAHDVIMKAEYCALLQRVHEIIDESWAQVPLDAKLESLVAARLLGDVSPHQERVVAEVFAVRHPAAPFFTDPTKQQGCNIRKSEHRNVLFAMAQRPWTPKTTGPNGLLLRA